MNLIKSSVARVKVFLSSPKNVKLTKVLSLVGVMSFTALNANAEEIDIEGAVKKLAGLVLTISTGAAIIGVGSGVMLKKFSMGKPDRIETGNKLIRDSILGWIILNGLGLILTWVNTNLLGNTETINLDDASDTE